MAFAGAKNRKGDKGDQGLPGKNGKNGEAATVEIGIVKTGDKAKVWNTGDKQNAILNFILPRGEKGEKGDRGNVGAPGFMIGESTGGTLSSLLGFFTKFSCGKLINFDPEDYQMIDCCTLPNTLERQKIDLGELKDLCV